ncbi:MAG: Na+/H+ antiporter NhaA [Actinomycetota bacterium]
MPKASDDETAPFRERFVVRPLQLFLRTEAAGGILLLAAASAALIWVNLAPGSYENLWDTELTVGAGRWTITEDIRHWINDAAMALFFFVVGLEIKRELVAGELRDRRAAVLPAAAALGGMVVPALIFLAVTAGGSGSRGWGIPMATDIAFAVGVLAVVGRGLPVGLKLFLLTLAIVDDIGAILMIAFFYTDSISIDALGIAVGLLAAVVLLRRLGVGWGPVHLIFGVAVWVAVFESGVHATIAGVALALVTPARISPQLEQIIHPWTSFLVVPMFALANAGVRLAGAGLDDATSREVAAGVIVGLVVGKIVGITFGAAVATRLGIARLPEGVGWTQVIGIAALGGIGFTVSLFIAGLAYSDGPLLSASKVGILSGSLVSGVVGTVLLARARRVRADEETG